MALPAQLQRRWCRPSGCKAQDLLDGGDGIWDGHRDGGARGGAHGVGDATKGKESHLMMLLLFYCAHVI